MLSIIIPCYNEEENLKIYGKELFPHLDKLNTKYEVILVNDGSKDSTLKEMKKLKKKNKNVKVISYSPNGGLGYAVKQGIKAVIGDLTVTLDSDLTFHPKLISKLLERYKKGDVDCVIGSPSLEGYDKSVPFYRIFLSKGANTLYWIILSKKITAVSPIFRLYKTKKIKNLKLESNKFEINSEILFKLLKNKCKVAEVPAALTTRKYGVSKLNNRKEIINHLKLMAKMIYWKFT